jgi:hypothetical protein
MQNIVLRIEQDVKQKTSRGKKSFQNGKKFTVSFPK